ncbi:MAG: hypothetical protein AB8G99_00410, partial [Planctomycetaceae bacterium]
MSSGFQKRCNFLFNSLIALTVVVPTIAGQEISDRDAVTITTCWSSETAKSGDQLVLAIVLEIADGYHIGNSTEHILKRDQGKIMPTTVKLALAGIGSS